VGIRRIRRALREGRFEFTAHALDEMDEDDLTDADIQATILRGSLLKTFTDDARGPRFVVRGLARTRHDEIEVVCRFLPSGRMRIVTAYRVDE
jgi:hypothetical protein